MPKLFENLWAKLAALLLAFLLWFHVATDKVFQYEITLKLEEVDVADDLALSEAPPSEFTVIVSAPGKRLLRSDWKKSGVRLIIDRSRPGRFKMDFDHTNVSLITSANIELVSIVSPREAVLECDQKIRKDIPVKSAVTIIPDEGFIISKNDSLVPDNVVITGPKTLVNKVEYIETRTEMHAGVRNDLSMRVPLVYPDIYGLSIFPDTVNFFVSVSPIKTRVFSKIPIRFDNAPFNYDTLLIIEPGHLEVRVGGLPDQIDSIQPEDISAVVEYISTDGRKKMPVTVEMPSSLTLLHQSVDSVELIRK